jgi:hypothetical protein
LSSASSFWFTALVWYVHSTYGKLILVGDLPSMALAAAAMLALPMATASSAPVARIGPPV